MYSFRAYKYQTLFLCMNRTVLVHQSVHSCTTIDRLVYKILYAILIPFPPHEERRGIQRFSLTYE